jgi:hypothetical protein
MKALTPVAFIVLFSFPVIAQEIYKWEDENGVIHYGDTPKDSTVSPLEKEELPYSHTGSLPEESSSERKARLRTESKEARLEDTQRLPSASPRLSRSKAWIEKNGRLRLSGAIRNSGKGQCDAPSVEVVIFDGNGSEDGSFVTTAAFHSLAYGEETRFEGEYFTPVGDALSWHAVPRCGAAEGTVYGASKQGTLKITHSRTIRSKRLRSR